MGKMPGNQALLYRLPNLLSPHLLWNHPAFQKGKGCTAYLRGDEDVRKEIDYGSTILKEHYNKRTSSKRFFSRRLTLFMQKPRVYGLNTLSKQCTIAHITVLSIALTAAKLVRTDKVRFVKKFISNLKFCSAILIFTSVS
jgi:hypothetical protein